MTEETNAIPAFAEALQMVRDAKKLLDKVAEMERELLAGELPELFADFTLPVSLFGQVLMNHLPDMEIRMAPSDKVFWLQVAEEIGPDHVASLRHVGGFMNKTAEF